MRIGWALYVRIGRMEGDARYEGAMYQPLLNFLLKRFLKRWLLGNTKVVIDRVGRDRKCIRIVVGEMDFRCNIEGSIIKIDDGVWEARIVRATIRIL
jgi:hypothetical protein